MSTSPYNEAGNILNDMLKSHKGIKSIVFSNNKKKTNVMKCSKSTYATICQTLQYKPVLDEILNRNDGDLHGKVMKDCRNEGLAYILLFELLFGKYGSIRGGGALKRTIMEHEPDLRTAAAQSDGVILAAVKQLQQQQRTFPKYVRVNTLKFTTSHTDAAAATHHVAQVLSDHIAQQQKQQAAADSTTTVSTTVTTVYADEHVPDLLVLSPNVGSDVYSHPLVAEGKIIFQDKSSCFPALCLIHGLDAGVDIIDACAAPGNKTTHLAALLQQQLASSSTVFAFDRDSKRIKILNERIELLVPNTNDKNAKNNNMDKKKKNKSSSSSSPKDIVITIHKDFLQTDPNDSKFVNVKGILVDPSCSGSGMVNQPKGKYEEQKNDEDRLKSLANFQIVALKHAMSFPQVERIVYSTCSVHEEENELVAIKALQEHNGNDSSTTKWKICRPTCLDTWKRRGNVISDVVTEEDAQCMIRCNGLDGDETNGFFVCLFKRITETAKDDGINNNNKTIKSSTTSTDLLLPIYSGQFLISEEKKAEPKKEGIGQQCATATTTTATQKKDSKKRITRGNASNQQDGTVEKHVKKQKREDSIPTSDNISIKKKEATTNQELPSEKVTSKMNDAGPTKKPFFKKPKKETTTNQESLSVKGTSRKNDTKKKKPTIDANKAAIDNNVHNKKKAKKALWNSTQKDLKENRLLKKPRM